MTEKPPAIPHDPVPKLALTRAQCARSLGIGIRMVDVLIAGRRGNGFPVVYIGTKPIVPVRELRDWMARQDKGGARRRNAPRTPSG